MPMNTTLTDQELIDFVAEKVMGWERQPDEHQPSNATLWVDPENPPHGWARNPLTSMDDSWMVVEKMSAQDIQLTVEQIADVFHVTFDQYSGTAFGQAEGGDAGRAICIAALRACGENV